MFCFILYAVSPEDKYGLQENLIEVRICIKVMCRITVLLNLSIDDDYNGQTHWMNYITSGYRVVVLNISVRLNRGLSAIK